MLVEKAAFGYDNNGNETIIVNVKYVNGQVTTTENTINEYDVYNQLVKTTTPDGTVITNIYNAEGLRVEKTVNGSTTRYLYEYSKVVLELDGSRNQKARNIYGTNLLLRQIGQDTMYYMYNGHADVTALINGSGVIVGSYYYDAFGNVIEESGSIDNPYRYSGYSMMRKPTVLS